MANKIKIQAEFPEKMHGLFEPRRYKVYYGGRGGAKSWSIARALVIKGANEPLCVLCCREFQKSIKDSVHRLLKSQIENLGLDAFYDIKESWIKGKPGTTAEGTEFLFEGLHHNVRNIKSLEGADIVWVEEAHMVSKSTWATLIPTIRKAGSEIWISFNPELKEDETYQRFVVNPPSDAVVQKVLWSDNPWFPDVLYREMMDLKERDYDSYLNVWEGHCREILEGAVFADQIRSATQGGRICRVPYDPLYPVDTYWDLGFADFTSIWFVQPLAMEFRIIDFYQNHLKDIQHYLSEIQARKYVHRIAYLPHDADHATLAAGGRTIKQQVKAAGFDARVVPRMPSESFGINAARAAFPMCYFDERNCADGLHALRHYRYDYDNDTGKYSEKPVHDWSSHASKAFMQLGLSVRVEPTLRQIEESKKVKPWDPWAVLNDQRSMSL